MHKIRDANLSDLPYIVEIYNASIPGRQATADLEKISVESRLGWFKDNRSSDRPIWVLEIEEEIAGWLSFQSFKDRAAYHKTAELSIYVCPTKRRQGVGKQLLNQAITKSPQLNITHLLALVFAHNLPSLQLFKQHKFEQWGYLPGIAELDQQRRDLIILGRKIEEY